MSYPAQAEGLVNKDNTISVAQGSTATPGATPGQGIKRIIYIYVCIYLYTPDLSIAETTLDVQLQF